MNRTEKRKLTKQLKTKGYSNDEIERMLMVKSMMDSKKNLKEGQRVKLNVSQIKSRKDWPSLTNEYKSWVESHADGTYTVEFDEKHKNNSEMVCLKEDESIPKWLFWEGDLMEVNDTQ